MLLRLLVVATIIISGVAQADLQHELAHLHSMQAYFEQITTTPQGQQLKSQGFMWLVKPNQFRWQVKSPNAQLYISDGKILWTYEADLLQATEQPLQLQPSQMPILLLSGQVGQLKKLFVVTQLKTGRYCLVPKQADGIIQAIALAFDQGIPQKLIIRNSNGYITAIQFTHVVLNHQMSAGLFHFTPPKGVDVLR